MLALEKHLVLQNSFAFHCAYLDFEGKAILFSGPSGIGKTTHTNLWCQYLPDQAKVLNGDKCLLSREGNTFYANGWPICGSSGICHNERREVRAVVLLQQAPENRLIEEKKISKYLTNVSLGEICRVLEYKSNKYGKKYIQIDSYYPSSQICSKCGYKNKEVKKLSVRSWVCPKCGSNHDRDYNIISEGLKKYMMEIK